MRLNSTVSVILGATALSLAACSSRSGPAPVISGKSSTNSMAPMGNTITVSAGDTVYSLAYKHNLSTRELIQANNLQAPYPLKAGQILVLPGPGAIIDKPISQSTFPPQKDVRVAPTSIEPIKSSNDDSELASDLHKGAGMLKAPDLVKTTEVKSAPKEDPEAVAERKALERELGKSDYKPKAPGVLEVPEEAPKKKVKPSVEQVEDTTNEAPSKSPPQESPVKEPQEPVSQASSFSWPLQGDVIKGFGGGNNGLNIAAPQGTPVKAAADGKVAYVGNEARGFGNVILVKHDGGWITAYAHIEKALVSRGQAVTQGQTIAKVGSTGNVQSPQLHFEIRKGMKGVDPKKHLG